MPDNLPSINLVKNKQIPTFDKFIDWTLTIGRLIVILTEIVAIIAFIYRFSLDEKIVNLHSVIKQQQSIISVLKNDESKYRNLQDRIALASTFSTKSNSFDRNTTDIISLIPDQARIINFILNKDQIKLKVDITSISSLENLVNSLKGYSGIKSINIDNIENKPSVGLSVDITTMLK